MRKLLLLIFSSVAFCLSAQVPSVEHWSSQDRLFARYDSVYGIGYSHRWNDDTWQKDYKAKEQALLKSIKILEKDSTYKCREAALKAFQSALEKVRKMNSNPSPNQ